MTMEDADAFEAYEERRRQQDAAVEQIPGLPIDEIVEWFEAVRAFMTEVDRRQANLRLKASEGSFIRGALREELIRRTHLVPCPKCGSDAGFHCVNLARRERPPKRWPHDDRVSSYLALVEVPDLCIWPRRSA